MRQFLQVLENMIENIRDLVDAEGLVGVSEHLLLLFLDEFHKVLQIRGRGKAAIQPEILLEVLKGLNPRAAISHLKELYADYDKTRTVEQLTI